MSADPYGLEYDPGEWEHGLRCATCKKLFEEGDRYASQWDGFIDDIPVTVIVCLECALTVVDDGEVAR